MRTSPHLSEDRLLDLVNDLLSREEGEDALRHLKGCPPCEDRLRLLVAERERTAAAPQPRIVNGRIVLDPVKETSSRTGWRTRGLALAAFAAAAMLALFVWAPQRQAPNLRAPEIWIPSDRAQLLMRDGESPEQGATFEAALRAYEERDERRALDLLRQADVPDNLEDIRQMYVASALVLNRRAEEAEALLEALDLSTMPQPERRWSRLVLYSAWRQLGRDAPAAELLESLATEPGEVGRIARTEKARLDR